MRKLRAIPQSIRAHLGHTVEELRLSSSQKHKRNKLIQQLQQFEATHLKPGETIIDYLLVEHYVSKSIEELAREVGIAAKTIGKIFQLLHLPKFTHAQAMQRNLLQRKGIHGLSSEQQRVYSSQGGRIGGRQGFLHGKGIHSLSGQQKSANKQAWWNSLPLEQRRKHKHRLKHFWNSLTEAQQRVILHKIRAAAKKRWDALTPEQQAESLRKLQIGWDAFTPAQRKQHRKRIKQWWASLTFVQQSNIIEKRRNGAAQKPNRLERIAIQLLVEERVYAPNATIAQPGQVYYADARANRRYIKLKDGYIKVPDFKVKGQHKVIEVYGDYWHSEKLGRINDLPQYWWLPEQMVQAYLRVGYHALVFWEHELLDPQQRQRIREEIRAFVAAPPGKVTVGGSRIRRT